MHSPVVPPASASGTRAESPAALPREAARVLFGEEPILEDEYSSPKEPKTRSRDTSAKESLFRASPTREASVGGFSRATRARLHAAGADAALPPDVRLALRASAGGAYAQTVSEFSASAAAPRAPSRLDVLAELEDARDVNDVVVQFLAYRSFPTAASRLAERRGGSLGSDGPAGFDSRGDDSRGAVGRMTDDRVDDETLGGAESLTARSLDSVRFTFDFFDFPTVTSRACGLTEATRPDEPRLIVPAAHGRRFADASAAEASGGAEPQRAGEAWFQFTVDGRVGNGAGDAVADSAESIDARRASFARYLADGPPVSVDVWDGTSLLQVGTCELDVSALARRGRDAADALVEAVVRDHRHHCADVLSAVHVDSEPHPPPIGALLVRLINVGRRGGGGGGIALEKKKASAPIRAAPDSGGELAASLRAGAVIAANERTNELSAVSASTPPRDASAETCTTDTRAGARDALEAQETRKLARERRLREIRGAASSSRRGSDEPAFVFGDARSQSVLKALSGKRAVDSSAELETRSLTVRAKLLESVDAARRRAKREAVLRKLRETSEFKKTVRPRFGELCFFEHPFRNGSDREGVFEIRCDDPDIVLVTSSEDRAALRELRARDGAYDDESAPPRDAFVDLEDDAFDGNRLFLAAGESARLAFTFQSFEKYEPANKSPSDADSPHLRPRSAVIHFVDTNEGVSVHALVVDVRPRAAQIARAFAFHASEDDFWKTEIPVPDARNQARIRSSQHRRFAARVSDPAVAVSVLGGDRESAFVEPATNAQRSIEKRPIAVSLRAKCGAAAEPNDARTFFVNVYGDEHLATLLLTWRVTLRVAPKVDITATVGQTTRASVAVRGGTRALAGPGPRRVTAYTSRPAELRASFVPPSSPERAPLTELTLAFKPLAAGRSLDVVHLIDDSTGALAHVRLVASDARAPTPSRVFDARVAAAAQTHKKVSYSNPYATARAFVLRSTHPELLRFRPEVLELAPAGERGATRFFGMTFEPSDLWTLGEAKTEPSPRAPTEVTVFINDEQDATEECFRVRVFAAEEGG
jgi:nephrocystin-4